MHVSFKHSLTFVALAALSVGSVAAGDDTKFIKQPSLQKSPEKTETTTPRAETPIPAKQQPSSKEIAGPAVLPSSPQLAPHDAVITPKPKTTPQAPAVRQPTSAAVPADQVSPDTVAKQRTTQSSHDTLSIPIATPRKLNWVTAAPASQPSSSQQIPAPESRFSDPQVDPIAPKIVLGDIITTQRELAIQGPTGLKWSQPVPDLPPAGTPRQRSNALSAAIPADVAVVPTNAGTQQTQEQSSAQATPSQLVVSNDYHTSMPNVQVRPEGAEKNSRQQLASLVSHQIVGSGVSRQQVAIDPMHAPAGWSSIREQLLTHVNRCESLLRKRAFFSAREEAEKGITYLAQVLDGMENRYHCEPAWSAARLALEESEDFLSTERTSTNPNFLRQLIDSHETPVLKTAADLELAPATAAQRYRFYAECCLMEAAQNHTWASDLLYSAGRSYQAQSDSADGNKRLLRWRAISFYRAAVGIDKTNSLAACNLGFCLLQMGLDQEAHQVLLDASRVRPNADVLKNLIESSRRTGDEANMQVALASLQPLPNAAGKQPPATVIQEIPDWQFRAMSPRTASPSAGLNPPSGQVQRASAMGQSR